VVHQGQGLVIHTPLLGTVLPRFGVPSGWLGTSWRPAGTISHYDNMLATASRGQGCGELLRTL